MSLFNSLQARYKESPRLRTWILRSGSVLGALVLFLWLRVLATVDPFSSFRKPPTIDANIGIRLEDVEIRHFSGSELRASGRAARVDVRQDRQYMDLYGIRDGAFYTKKGSIRFEAERANWNGPLKKIQVTSGARVSGDRYDLAVNQFSIDQANSVLRAPGQITGTIGDGRLIADNLVYHLDNGNYAVGPVEWEGLIANPLQDSGSDSAKKTHWSIKCLGIMTHENDIDRFPDGEATDGDVIVKADLVERNTKTDVITATGHVRYFSSKTNLICGKAVIYRKEKRAVFTGDVNMVFKPEDQQDKPVMVVDIPPFTPEVPDEIAKSRPPAPPDTQPENQSEKDLDEQLHSGDNAKKYPVSALSQKVEYWYEKGNRHAIITGNPQAEQDLPGGRWRRIWSPQGLYDGEKETLKLVSDKDKRDTRVKTSLGDDLTADWFQISTKDGDDKWSGSNVQGSVYVDDSEIPKETKKQGETKQGEKPKPLPAGPIGPPPTTPTRKTSP